VIDRQERPAVLLASLSQALSKDKAWPKSGLDRAANRKTPRPFLISGPASQSIPGWNQIMEWLREVQRIREIAGEAAA